MKRPILILSMLCGLLAFAPAAHAQGTGVLPLRQAMSGAFSHLTHQHRLSPLAISHDPVRSGRITSSNQLRIDPGYLGVGAGFTLNEDKPMSPSDAYNNTVQGEFLHTVPYTNLGALGLWYEEAVAHVTSSNNTDSLFYTTYLASYYTNEDNASAAFNDAVGGWATLSPSQCPIPAGAPSPHQCSEVTWTPQPPFQDNNGNIYRFRFRVLQISNALFEYGYVLEQGVFNANSAAGDKYLTDVSQGIAGLFTTQSTPVPTQPATTPTPRPTLPPTLPPTTTPTPTPTPTQVPVNYTVEARWEKAKQKPNPQGALLKTSKKGKAVQADVYIIVNSGPPGATVSLQVQVLRNGKAVASTSDQGNLDKTDPTGWYPDPFSYKPSKTGKYTIYTRIQIGSVVQTAQSGTLTVKK